MIEFKISSLLRLAELCGASESDKKKFYMNEVEKLLLNKNEKMNKENEIPISFYRSNCENVKTLLDFINFYGKENILGNYTDIVYQDYKKFLLMRGITEMPYQRSWVTKNICGLTGFKSKRVRVPKTKELKYKYFLP